MPEDFSSGICWMVRLCCSSSRLWARWSVIQNSIRSSIPWSLSLGELAVCLTIWRKRWRVSRETLASVRGL